MRSTPGPLNWLLGLPILGLLLASAGGCIPPVEPIAADVDLHPEWVEIVPSRPLRVRDVHREICLEIRGAKFADFDTSAVILETGASSRLEAELLDDRGQRYRMQVNAFGYKGVCLSRLAAIPGSDRPDPGFDLTAYELPANRTYPKVYLRSELPLRAQRVTWINYHRY